MDCRRGAQCRAQRGPGQPRRTRPADRSREHSGASRLGRHRRDRGPCGGRSCRVTPGERRHWRRPTMARRVAMAWAVAFAVAATANAQSGSSGTAAGQSTTATQTPSSSTATETRAATTTFFGDTGLWFVPTGEVLPHGKWSVSGYRRGTNWVEGYTNVADFAGTFGVGIGGRAEIFGSFLVDTRIDRDVRPLFLVNNSAFGGIVDR